jgi:hypothetical protein
MKQPSNEVIIMRNVAGSAWLHAGRTPVCPTPEWLREHFGKGRYELRLMNGNRLLCVVQVGT